MSHCCCELLLCTNEGGGGGDLWAAASADGQRGGREGRTCSTFGIRVDPPISTTSLTADREILASFSTAGTQQTGSVFSAGDTGQWRFALGSEPFQ